MSQFLTFLFVEGNGGGPWGNKERISVLCPVPGYDRHFKLCETFGINMISVPLTGRGPDLDEVKRLVETDESIRGIWCVPKYSNPTGEVYSRDTTLLLLYFTLLHSTPPLPVLYSKIGGASCRERV